MLNTLIAKRECIVLTSLIIILFVIFPLFSSAFAAQRNDNPITIAIGHPPPPSTGTGNGPGPNTDTCGGKYNLQSIPKGKNFGDPLCDFTKDALASLLQQEDAKYWTRWYTVIVPGESAYNPNAVEINDPVEQTGAWGLFQMSQQGASNQYNRGDVYWKTQTSNAIHYNEFLDVNKGTCSDGVYHNPITWCYWSTAHQWWGQKL